MSKMLCIIGLLVLSSCANFGHNGCSNCCSKESGKQCDMHGKEQCAKCNMDKTAPAATDNSAKK